MYCILHLLFYVEKARSFSDKDSDLSFPNQSAGFVKDMISSVQLRLRTWEFFCFKVIIFTHKFSSKYLKGHKVCDLSLSTVLPIWLQWKIFVASVEVIFHWPHISKFGRTDAWYYDQHKTQMNDHQKMWRQRTRSIFSKVDHPLICRLVLWISTIILPCCVAIMCAKKMF